MEKRSFDFLVLVDNFFEGTSTDSRVWRTVKFLEAKQNRVCIICLFEEGQEREEVIEGIPVYRIIPVSVTRPVSLLRIREQVAREITRRFSATYFWVNDHQMLNIGGLLKRRNPTSRLIYDSHEYFPDYHMGFESHDSVWIKLKSHIWRKIEQRLERRDVHVVDHFIASNASIAAMLSAKLLPPVPVWPIRNIPVFDKSTPLRLQDEATESFEKLEQLKGKTVLVYFGNFRKKFNGLEVVLKGLCMLPDVYLVLCGNSKSPVYFQTMIENLGLSSRIVKLDPVSPDVMPQVGSYAHISVVPTMESGTLQNYYSLSNKMMESAVMGIPIVCTNIPEHKNIMNITQSGVMINPFNEEKAVDEFIQAVSDILSSYEYYKGNAEKASSLFDFQQEFDSWYHQFQEE